MLGFAAENLTITVTAKGGEGVASAAEALCGSKAMWRAVVRNSKPYSISRPLRYVRSTSSLSLSATSSPSSSSPPSSSSASYPWLSACDAAAVARLSQGAPSWFCINLFSNNGEEQQGASSYQESVSTIDSVVCSLPVLTNHMGLVSTSSASSCHRSTCFQDSFRYSKAFGSAAHAVVTFEGAAETLEEQNLTADETFRLADVMASKASAKPSEVEVSALPSYETLRKTSERPSMFETMAHDTSEILATEGIEKALVRELHTSETLAAQNVATAVEVDSLFEDFSSEFIASEELTTNSILDSSTENLFASLESEATFLVADHAEAATSSLEMEEFVFRDSLQEAESGEPGVSSRVLGQTAAEKEVALALRRHRQKMRRRQRKMEMEACWKATLEYKNMVVHMCKKKLAPNVPFVRGLLLSWFEPYRDALQVEQTAIMEKEPFPGRSVYGQYLLQLPPDILAVVVMHKLMAVLMKEQEQGYVRLLSVASAVGEAVEQETEIYRIMKKKKNKRKKGEAPLSTSEVALQMNVEKMVKQQNVRLLGKTVKKERDSNPWGGTLQVKVGSRLIDILMNVAFIHPPASQSPTSDYDSPEVRPALKHEQRIVVGKNRGFNRKLGVLVCDPLVWTSLEKSAKFVEMPYMPMLVEPAKWTSYKKGGYLVLRSNLMRTHGARSQQHALSKTPKANLKNVFNALDTLGRTPWRINARVLDVIEKIWADGGRLADLVDRDNLEMPPKPATKDEQELKAWRREFFRIKRVNSERHSERCDTELKLSVARKYRKEAKFYYPHNVDFRGRAYPMHPNLNHLGSDLCRGLLEFAEGCPLGHSGLRWLKIQLANVYAVGGVDKLSFDGRVAFVDENLEDIMDSAMQPLEGKRWWLKAEDPFQCLAACMSLRDALDSGDVENFICYTPVQQDGSCNGLQHYAALGRDIGGAESVNLVAGEKPADVYSGIANRVQQIIEKDALQDSSVAGTELAKALIGHVDRKLVKQTVMTSVYGVTFIGARAQILNRLEEKGKDKRDDKLFSVSSYAAKATLAAIGEMFKEAKEIMNWLGECAKLVASQNEAVRWCSPLGLPIVQPYRKPGWKQVKTSLQIFLLRNDNDQPVFVKRQKTAFPPNFVHSLDSAHMMMTALACGEAGITFAGVHDSFWTHASDVDKLNKILREKFVELYSQPVLENLLNSFQKSFPDVEFPPIPVRGDFEMENVLKSPYFFN